MLGLFISVLVVWSATSRIKKWYRLRHVPGPRITGFTTLWFAWRTARKTVHEDIVTLTEKYGPVVRIAPNEVIVNDLEALLRISSVRSEYRKGEWYKVGRVSPGKDHLLCISNPELRDKRKRQMMPGYSGRDNDGFEDGINRAIASWVDLIDRKYLGTGPEFCPLDLATQAHYYSFDALGELAYSNAPGYLAADKDLNDVIKISDATLPFIHVLGVYPEVFLLTHKWPLRYLLPRDGDKAGFGAIMGYIGKFIDDRLDVRAKPKRDMLQSFIDHGMTADELRQELTLQFFVGTDTTAHAIRIILLFLLTNPTAYQRLQRELDDAAASGLISSPIRDSEARSLPYLQAVIKEGLRIIPPVATGLFYKVVPPGGDTINGVFLPGGTNVATGSTMWSLCRQKSFWGLDAESFRPERWLEVKDDLKLQAMTKTVELVFGSGQFVCAGRQIAGMQLNKVIAELLRRYNFTLLDPMKPMTLIPVVGWIGHDLMVRAEKR
ncbi:cytochrome P450 [Podospora didyma]|uniref:Cytochrome P450 n=1 Tax=Podospora didyma TaxID=330526 RepID=A0AAE0NR53_9PEZI|nr:cytochrome P450 [Podospora didyma]